MHQVFSQNLVAGFNDRNEKAVTSLYTSYIQKITNKVIQLTHGAANAADLAGEVMTRLLEHPRPFETVRSIEFCIGKIIRSVCKDEMRKKKYRTSRTDGLEDHHKKLEEQSQASAEIRSVCRELHYHAIEMLSPRTKQVFLLRYIHDMKHREIAEELRISIKTEEYHWNQATNQLKLDYIKRNGGIPFLLLFIILVFVTHLLIK